MKIEHQILHSFGLRRSTVSQIKQQSQYSLAHLGYPLLYQVSFFLTTEGITNLQEKNEIHFPERCCCCRKDHSVLLSYYQRTSVLFRKSKETIIGNVPHCKEHAESKVARLIATVTHWTESVTQISLTGTDLPFLLETVDMNQSGDVVPPWMAFSNYSIECGGWRQGNGEYWWNNVWLPFWQNLSLIQKREYLDQYLGSTDWIEYLLDL